MNTSELLMCVFVFLVGYMLFKRCGCIEGVGGDDMDDVDNNFMDQKIEMLNLITHHINKCNSQKVECRLVGSPSVTGGCDNNAEKNLKDQVNNLVNASIREGKMLQKIEDTG